MVTISNTTLPKNSHRNAGARRVVLEVGIRLPCPSFNSPCGGSGQRSVIRRKTAGTRQLKSAWSQLLANSPLSRGGHHSACSRNGHIRCQSFLVFFACWFTILSLRHCP